MEVLKYTVIKSKEQYIEYCNALEAMVTGEGGSEDEIDLLTVLIEKWDTEHNTFKDANPVELLVLLMQEHNMNATKLAESLGVSKGLVSDILNYKKGFSKESIRALAELFKVSQEAFNRPYTLPSLEGSSVSKTRFVSIESVLARGREKVHGRATQTSRFDTKVTKSSKKETSAGKRLDSKIVKGSINEKSGVRARK